MVQEQQKEIDELRKRLTPWWVIVILHKK
jgi:predicted CDP-diglyceride synthetase/phosphatidate cytidylyltransferase